MLSVSCKSVNNFRVSQGGFNYDKFDNTLQELQSKLHENDFRGWHDGRNIEGFDSSRFEKCFQDNFDEDLQIRDKGGEKKMSEVNDIISNLSSFIICGYTLIKSVIAIINKLKTKKD